MPKAIVREDKGLFQHSRGLSEDLRSTSGARPQGPQRRKQNQNELGRFFPREAGSGQNPGPGTFYSLVSERFVPGNQ